MTKKERHNYYKKAYAYFKRNTEGLRRGEPICGCLYHARNILNCSEFSEFWSFQPDRGVFDYWAMGMEDKEAYLFRETVLLFCITMTES
jgi:hypothetical protein